MFGRNFLLTGLTASLTLAASLTVTQAVAAQSVTPVYGAGASFPSLVYRGLFDCYGVPVVGIPNRCDPGTGAYAAAYPTSGTSPINPDVQFLYASIGSGAGLDAFVNGTAPTANPSSNPPATSALFPTYPYPTVDFGASDSVLSSSRNTTYDASQAAKRGPRLEVPIIAGPVALPYQSGGNFRSLGTNGLRLSRNTYCGILTGNITNWNNSLITTDNGTTVLRAGVTSLPITVYRRSDGSGTTEILSRHLDTVCVAPGFDWTGGVGTTVAWTASFVGASGSSNLVAGVSATAGGIGYANLSFVAPIAPGGLPTARLRNQAGQYITPSAQSTFDATELAPTPPAGTRVWAPLIPNPTGTTAYPIIGFTFINFYSCYSDPEVVAALRPSTTSLTAADASVFGWAFSFPTNIVNPSGPPTLSVPDSIIVFDEGNAPLAPNQRTFVKTLLRNNIQLGPVPGVCTL